MRLTYVEGASPDKWLAVWTQRHPRIRLDALRVTESDQLSALDSGECDWAIVRIDDAPASRADLVAGRYAVEIYREQSVVVLPREHAYADEPELTLDDLAEFDRTPPQATIEDTLAVTAAGVGVTVVPMSVARLFHRRDLVSVPLADGPEWPVLLAWIEDSELAQDFAGITRGRGARSSR